MYATPFPTASVNFDTFEFILYGKSINTICMPSFSFLNVFRRFDWIFFVSTTVLFLLGLAAIYSVELSREAAEFALIRKQLIACGLGLILYFVLASTNVISLRNYARGMYLFGVLLLVLVLLFGREISGTKGWFVIFGFSFQPVEFMKFALAVQLARYFGEHARRRFGWKEIFGSGLLMAIPFGLVMMQPDLGSALLLFGLWVMLMIFAGIKIHHVSVLAGIGGAFSILSWFFLLQPFQKNRINVFLNPELDPLGVGYNINQAKIAIGSGKLFGRGLGFGSQSQLKFLPESQTDFIFAVIAEELGFLGIMILLSAWAIVFWRIVHSAYSARDNFSAFLAAGIFSLFFVQMTVNIGVNMAILPATGIALPFVSYGGSSLLISCMMAGVAQSMMMRSERWQTDASRSIG